MRGGIGVLQMVMERLIIVIVSHDMMSLVKIVLQFCRNTIWDAALHIIEAIEEYAKSYQC